MKIGIINYEWRLQIMEKSKNKKSSEYIQKITQKVIFEREGKILMMKDTNGNWELPGGCIDFGEKPEIALERELNEEMGLTAGQYEIGEMIGKFNIIRHFPDKHYHFLALVYKGELKVDDFQVSEEHTECGWFNVPEILNLQMVEGYREFFETTK